jgi:MYXO-CTERM domain-containing protein
MSTVANRLDMHFAALAAVGAVAGIGAAQHAEASIVYSGVVNLAVQTSTNGLYLNLVTGAINEPGNTTGGAGWDINIYGSTPTAYGSGNPGYAYVGSGGNVAALLAGATIDGTTATATGSASMAGFPTTGGAYYGFKFTNESNSQLEYGWALYIKGTGASGAGTLVSYAYENTGAGIAAGAVPAPTAGMGLLALGGAGLLGRRRK